MVCAWHSPGVVRIRNVGSLWFVEGYLACIRPISDYERFVLFSHPCDLVLGTSIGEDSTVTLQPMLQVPRLRAASIVGLVVSVNKTK